jgi:hypothetical protein
MNLFAYACTVVYVCMQCSCRPARSVTCSKPEGGSQPAQLLFSEKVLWLCACRCASMCECMRACMCECMRALACVLVTAQHAYTSERTCYFLPLTLPVVISLHRPLPLAPAVALLPFALPPSLLTLSPSLSLRLSLPYTCTHSLILISFPLFHLFSLFLLLSHPSDVCFYVSLSPSCFSVSLPAFSISKPARKK